MVPDRIEQEILIDAPVDVVWAIVSEPQHVAGWFSDSAEIELRPGGDASLTWEEHGTAYGRVERVEPPNFISFRWARPMDEPLREENATLVEFSLSEEGEQTRLRVVESGFRELEGSEDEKTKYADGNVKGWKQELGELQEYVAKHVGEAATR